MRRYYSCCLVPRFNLEHAEEERRAHDLERSDALAEWLKHRDPEKWQAFKLPEKQNT